MKNLGLVLLAAAIVLGLTAPLLLPTFAISLLSLTLVAGVLATSVNMLAGQAGLVSIGHAGIAAAGSYGIAWGVSNDYGLATQLGVAAALIVVVSLAYGLMTMRTNGIVFLMITLALGMIVFGLVFQLSTVTGGQSGLTGIRRPGLLASSTAFYYFAFFVLVAVLGALSVLRKSPFGLMLRGIRDSETRMSSLGYSVPAAKMAGVLISGLIAGLAGVLAVWQSEFISPAAASFGRSAMAVVMVILGGTGSLLGPLVGAAIVVATEHWISSYVTRWPTLLGVVFILTVLFVPRGAVGTITAAMARRRVADARHTGPTSQDDVEALTPSADAPRGGIPS